jgi:N-dimethylarginine dimethylaminohydrolase
VEVATDRQSLRQRFGAQSMTAQLRRVVVRRPDRALGACDPAAFHYAAQPDLALAQSQHDGLVALLEAAGVEVMRHDRALPDHADAIFVHDPAIVTRAGAVALRMGKALRRGEEEALAAFLKEQGVPILARLHGEARAEGGDLLWLDESTLCVGLGWRTNLEGARQLQAALRPLRVDVLSFDLPSVGGAEACLHLQSLVSLLDADLAVVYPSLCPVRFLELLREHGVLWVEVPAEEMPTLGCNVLALAPRRCVMLEGNPVTRARLEAAGCEVATFRGDEVCVKLEGGPTCLTRPVLRAS